MGIIRYPEQSTKYDIQKCWEKWFSGQKFKIFPAFFVYQFLLQRFAADDQDRDGQISRPEFENLVHSFHPEEAPSSVDLQQVFTKYDHNKNDHIEFHEFVHMMLNEQIFYKVKAAVTFFS